MLLAWADAMRVAPMPPGKRARGSGCRRRCCPAFLLALVVLLHQLCGAVAQNAHPCDLPDCRHRPLHECRLHQCGGRTLLWLEGRHVFGTIPPSLASLTALRTLGLQGNQLTGSLPTALGSLLHLQMLSVAANRLSGRVPPLAGLTDLRMMELTSNLLTGDMPTLDGMRQLEVAYLDENRCVDGGWHQ